MASTARATAGSSSTHAPKEDAITPTEVAEEGKAGPVWQDDGFFISADGYFITNHHVATKDPKGPILKNISFMVRMDDGKDRPAGRADRNR